LRINVSDTSLIKHQQRKAFVLWKTAAAGIRFKSVIVFDSCSDGRYSQLGTLQQHRLGRAKMLCMSSGLSLRHERFILSWNFASVLDALEKSS